MPNKYVNKVVIGKETKLDLTADTVTPDKLAKGITYPKSQVAWQDPE